MTLNSRYLILAASLVAIPVAAAMAQQNNPAEANPAATAQPGAKNPDKPGATGRTVVLGDQSTVAGDKAGTAGAKTGQTDTGSSGGGAGR
jgi:hypothetical protein